MRSRYILSFVFIVLGLQSTSALGKGKTCAKALEEVASEMRDWEKYGILRDAAGVVEFPLKCTPFMKKQKFFPLPKRKAAGVNRERYLGKDCKIYEWDSQHGRFEVYKPNSKNTHLYHEGEATVVSGKTFESKRDSKRDNTFMETGIPGVRMKELCKKHGSGKLRESDVAHSRAGNVLTCF